MNFFISKVSVDNRTADNNNKLIIHSQMEDKKMKQTIAIITGALLLTVFSSAPARADRKTMEGVFIGTSVALIGAAIINELSKDEQPSYHGQDRRHHERPRHREVRHHRPPAKRYYEDHHRPYKKHYNHRRAGHWEIERIWVKPVYEKRWNPGHYNRRGKWVSGRYEKFMVARGYWKEQKVWVRHYRH